MLVINANNISRLLDFKFLIQEIKSTFKQAELAPRREIYNINNDILDNSQLLTMPAFIKKKYYGVKLLNVFPNNPIIGSERVKAVYVLFNKNNGDALAIIDGTLLTKFRTAAMSALASSYLSRKNSKKLLIMGTGSLVSYMIFAHASVRPIEEVFVWGRDYTKAKKVVAHFKDSAFNLSPIRDFSNISNKMDIISTVTSANEPFLFSRNLSKGTHLDLVGAHTIDMMELDSKAFSLGDIYVESYDSALNEAGDLIKSIDLGFISRKNIKNDITNIIVKDRFVRIDDKQITIFKSVGHSLSDLAAAILVYKKYLLHSKS